MLGSSSHPQIFLLNLWQNTGWWCIICIDTLIVKFQFILQLSCKYSDFTEFSYELLLLRNTVWSNADVHLPIEDFSFEEKSFRVKTVMCLKVMICESSMLCTHLDHQTTNLICVAVFPLGGSGWQWCQIIYVCEMSKSLALEELSPSTVIFYFKQIDHDLLNLFTWYAICSSIFRELFGLSPVSGGGLTGINLDTDLFSWIICDTVDKNRSNLTLPDVSSSSAATRISWISASLGQHPTADTVNLQ